MRLTGPVFVFASFAAGQDVVSGLTAVLGGFTSDLADGASVITSTVANPGDAFETITSNIGGVRLGLRHPTSMEHSILRLLKPETFSTTMTGTMLRLQVKRIPHRMVHLQLCSLWK